MLAKDLKDEFIGKNIKQKVRIKTQQMNFLKSNFVGVNKLFVLVYTNEAATAKSCKAEIYYLPKCIINFFWKVKQKCFYKKLYIKA